MPSVVEQASDIGDLQHRYDALRLLHDTTVAAHDAATPEQALRLVAQRICEHTGWPSARVLLVQDGEEYHKEDEADVAVPVPVDGRVWAILEFSPAGPASPDAELLAAIGANVGRALERTAGIRELAHALRNPVAALAIAAETFAARDEQLSSDQRTVLLGSLLNGTQRLKRLVADLLDAPA